MTLAYACRIWTKLRLYLRVDARPAGRPSRSTLWRVCTEATRCANRNMTRPFTILGLTE